MKTLCLMRHAEAEKGAADHSRILTERGRLQAHQAALWLQGQDIKPELIVASDSARTRQTAEVIAAVFGSETVFLKQLYLAEQDVILEQAAFFSKDKPSILLIAHNPGIFESVRVLSQHRGEETMGMPPAGCVVYQDGVHIKSFLPD